MISFSIPWPSSFSIWSDARTGTITVTIDRPPGEIITKKYDADKISYPINIINGDPISIEASEPGAKIYLQLGKAFHLYESGFTDYPHSDRYRFEIFRSLLTTTFAIFFLLYFFIRWIRNEDRKFILYTLGVFLCHLVILGLMYTQHLPGYSNYDSFDNFTHAGIHNVSFFTGFFYSGMLMVLFHLFPSYMLVSLLTIFVISAVLSFLFYHAYKLRVHIIYFIVAGVFYLIPTSYAMSFTIGRDTLAHWVLFLNLMSVMLFFRGDLRGISLEFLLGISLFSCLLRPEIVYIMPFALMALFYQYKFSKVLIASCLLFLPITWVANKRSLHHADRRERIVYETTTLINPLSSIMYELYPDGIPDEVKSKFGNFFKMDYLITHHNEDDIDPYHRGGLNHGFSFEEYDQFKSETLRTFATHPILFLKNRLRVADTMLGLTNDPWVISDDYFVSQNPQIQKMKEELQLPEFRPTQNRFLDYTFSGPRLILRSYLIPLVMLLTLCAFIPFKSIYWKVVIILLARTCLVFLTSPAGYFKYNYILWLFALFALPFWLSERRSILTNVQPTLKTQ